MARPRQGEGIKRTIRKKGDKLYAYETTSRMENGKRKTTNTYLGRVDPETNELLEKIPEKSRESRGKIAKQREITILEDIEVGDYGGVYLIDSIQKRMRLGQDLADSFGSASVSMMSIAVTLIQCGGVFEPVRGRLKRTWTSNYYDLAGSFDSGSLSRMTKEIGVKAQCNIESFFEKRIRRNKGIAAWDTTTQGCHSDMEGMAEYVGNNKDGEDLKQVKTGFATDVRGVPMMYRHYAGNVSDMDTVKLLADDIERFGGSDAVFVMDRGFCSGWNLRYMLTNGHRAVVPANTSSKAVKSLLTEFSSASEKADMEHDGHMYSVWKTEIGIASAEGRTKADGDQAYTFTVKGDVDHGSEGILTAYVCFDTKKYSDEMQSHNKMISGLKKKASEIDSKDPVAAFRKIAGKAAKHFEISADGRKAVVKEKRNSKSFEENRAGLFVMLATPDIEWGTAMSVYDARRLTEQAFDRKKGESPRFNTSDLDSMRGREFLRFLDLMIRCEMAAEIRESGKENTVSVECAVSMADCVQAKRYHGTMAVGAIDKKEREIFELFKVPLPKEVKTGQLIFDMPQ